MVATPLMQWALAWQRRRPEGWLRLGARLLLGAGAVAGACAPERASVPQPALPKAAAGTPSALPRATRAAAPAAAPVDQKRTELRLRVTGLDPGQSPRAAWRRGGEGLGGTTRRGEFRDASGQRALAVGEWSRPVPLGEVLPPGDDSDGYLTLTAGESGREPGKPVSKNVRFELEQIAAGAVVRRLEAVAPEGGTLTLLVPAAMTKGFVNQLSTAAEVAEARRQLLMDHAGTPARALPQKWSILSDLGGFGSGFGYGIRVTDPKVVDTELDSLLRLGVTGLRALPESLRAGLPGAGRFRARVLGPIGYPTTDKRREPSSAGCPFDPGIAARAARIAESALTKARAENSDTVWTLTQDEIGAVTDQAPEGKAHLATCERCRAGFVGWLKQQGLTPAELGAGKWDEVRPLPIWNNPERPWLASAGLRRRAFLTRQFLNVASASMFSEIRAEFSRYNAAPRASDSREPRAIYSYALRGSNFLSNGSSLDLFEFYRHADNAIVWETSNRDARSWGWDSYLMDVQRVVAERLGLAEGIYIKPHRGAAVQRALSAVARGNSLIYWYTYGPDYWKGDAFSGDRVALLSAQRAAQLLGAAEPWLFGATLAEQPRVAIVKPETTLAWANLSAEPGLAVASWENAKWVYSALQHAHVPVDPLDERLLSESKLERYAAIYVNGSHLTRQAALALVRYVKGGGVLVASAGGLQWDEASEPLRVLEPVFGVSQRRAAQLACGIMAFRAKQLDSLAACTERDRVQAGFDGSGTPLVIGSERLEPLPASEVLARFRDGSPAMLRHRFGKGRAFLLGTFAGLEYGAPVLRDGFDMGRDLDATRRSYLLEPLRGLVVGPVACSAPLVEPVLLKSADGGHALTLANWAYAAKDQLSEETGAPEHVALQPARDVRLVIHPLKQLRRAYSAALQRELTIEPSAAGPVVTLPLLEEGDVLRLE